MKWQERWWKWGEREPLKPYKALQPEDVLELIMYLPNLKGVFLRTFRKGTTALLRDVERGWYICPGYVIEVDMMQTLEEQCIAFLHELTHKYFDEYEFKHELQGPTSMLRNFGDPHSEEEVEAEAQEFFKSHPAFAMELFTMLSTYDYSKLREQEED